MNNKELQDSQCNVISLGGALYLAHKEDGMYNILGKYNGRQNKRLFFVHRYVSAPKKTVVGEMIDLKNILSADSMLSPARWNGERWVPGVMAEEEMPKGLQWSFTLQDWVRK